MPVTVRDAAAAAMKRLGPIDGVGRALFTASGHGAFVPAEGDLVRHVSPEGVVTNYEATSTEEVRGGARWAVYRPAGESGPRNVPEIAVRDDGAAEIGGEPVTAAYAVAGRRQGGGAE